MTHLRQLMLDELQRRNYSPNTVRSYLHAVEEFARHFHRSPEQLGPDHVREYQVHRFGDRKLSARTIAGQTAALRFLFVKTLRRPYLPDALPFPKQHKRLPTVLSQEEVARLIDATGNLMHRAMVMTLYATGVRRAELCRLKVADIDSGRMVLHILQGKGGRDRDVPLSPKLLATLREYWRWMKPKTYLFPGMENNWRADVPVNELKGRKIRVNVLSPGQVNTPDSQRLDKATREMFESLIPRGTMGRPEEIAAVALFLASDEASYVNGVELAVDGGFSAI